MTDIDNTTNKTPDQPKRRTNPKLVIGSLIVIATVAYLVYATAQGSAAYYLTVAELRQKGPGNETVRVAGLIADDSIRWQERELLLSFEIADESGSLPVTYQGPRPDMFKDGAEVVIEGTYGRGGVFNADTLMLKCPSKYEEGETNG
jgi:cytochrome c-type biogenesis protein CcmE